jgi:hypothetical protein
MKIEVSAWSMTRKKIRPSFHLGALSMLFSVSDKVSGPKLSDQDRLDAAYPYRLEIGLEDANLKTGRYWLSANQNSIPEVPEDLKKKRWQLQRGRKSVSIGTDLTEYERLLWEEWAAQYVVSGRPKLNFEADDSGAVV